ncbi:MAG TPA: DMT family transporter [Candidatus Saccharimonadales bacterium]|nr:DMT family transporter [Candidatus Saccharimonadales bacterium]
MFNSWQINLIFFYIFTVIFFQCYKLAVKNVKNDGAATIALQVIAGITVLILVPFFAINWPAGIGIILLLVASCVFYAINDRMQTTARKHLEVSTFSVIGQLSTVFVILYGLTLFNETFTWLKLAGAVLIIGANVLIFYQSRKHKIEINIYSILAILAAFAFATALAIDVGISKEFNLPLYISLTLLIPAIMIAIAGKVSPRQSVTEYKTNSKLFLATGISWALSIFFSLRAFQLGEMNTVITLEAVVVILNVLAAYIFLKERGKIKRKIAGAILIVFGVLLTTL